MTSTPANQTRRERTAYGPLMGRIKCVRSGEARLEETKTFVQLVAGLPIIGYERYCKSI